MVSCCLLASCTSFDGDKNPYQEQMQTLALRLVYPEEQTDYLRAGVEVKIKDLQTSNKYTATTDAEGCLQVQIPLGLYRVSVLDKPERRVVFNGTIEQVSLIGGDISMDVPLKLVKPGTLVIKEAYFGGCPALPAAGTYNYDRYVILHNNDIETLYLDSLCLSMVDPYNSYGQSGNYWTETINGQIVYRKYASVPDCVWYLAGSGKDFPLEPGADAVVVLNGAVDHTQTYPLSVNLNNCAYFVCYDPTAYSQPNSVLFHPQPGNQVLDSHHLKVIKKTGTPTSTTFAVSQNSPAVILFRAPSDVNLMAYLNDDSQSVVVRGSNSYTMIPWEWIVDGLEVFNKANSMKAKRLRPDVDAGGVEFSASGRGYTVHRYLDEEATEAAGYTVYTDTNNSSNDFYERTTQSLHVDL